MGNPNLTYHIKVLTCNWKMIFPCWKWHRIRTRPLLFGGGVSKIIACVSKYQGTLRVGGSYYVCMSKSNDGIWFLSTDPTPPPPPPPPSQHIHIKPFLGVFDTGNTSYFFTPAESTEISKYLSSPYFFKPWYR